MTGTSIRRPHDCSDNVEGESGPYLYCSARFLGFRFSSRGPAAHKTCKICIVVASVGSSPRSWYAHQSTARGRQNASKWSAVPASLIVLCDLRPGPRRQQLIQRVTAFVGANPRSLFAPDTDAKTLFVGKGVRSRSRLLFHLAGRGIR